MSAKIHGKRKSLSRKSFAHLVKTVEAKIQAGDISGGINLLSAEESFGGTTPDALGLKHPTGAEGMMFSADPSVQDFPPILSDEVYTAILSIPNGSVAGVDAL